jgi:hypothetical protein
MADATVKLVLIGGAQRSGTTLLQTLVANALNAPILPEAHILCDVLASYRRAKEAPNKTRFFYTSERDLLDFYRSCADRHLADLAETSGGGPVAVLKDPNFVQFDVEAAAVFPEAIRIAALRDPRDIAASFLRIGQRERQDAEAGKYRRRDIQFIGKKISGSYAELIDEPGQLSPHLVRYEELATRPRETLQALARRAGLELSLDRIDSPEWLEAEARHDAPWISELEGRKPTPASVGTYKSVMRPREVALIEEICAPYMAWAGYERSSPRSTRAEWSPGRIARNLLGRVRRGYWSYRGRFSQL